MSTREPLRIGLLADTVDKPGGIPRYTKELLAALGRRDDVRLVVAAPAAAAGTVRRLGGAGLEGFLPIPRTDQLSVALWERHRSGRAFARAGVGVVHGTKHLVPRGSSPTVLTVHDAMTLTRAHEAAPAKRMLLPRQFRASLRQATRLAAVSEATRDALAALDARWAAKTVVIPNGLSGALLDADPEPVATLAGHRFALVVGDLSPRKNVGLLLRVWPEVAAAADGLVLAMVGHDGSARADARAALGRLEEAGTARRVRGASDGALRWCYERASVVLFPSLEEGFGLPVLEALAFAAPLITSTDPALVEVSAGAPGVRHLDPGDARAWRDAVIEAAAHARPEPSGPTFPAQACTWEEHADRLVALYRELLTPGGAPSPPSPGAARPDPV